MSGLTDKHAVVIGASMGGLAAAKALSKHFGLVTVLEADALPSVPEPRRGTPQSRHLHVLLSGGRRALCELFPGFEVDLERAGAVRLNAGLDLRFETPGFDPLPQRDLGMELYCISRPSLEFITRSRLEQEANVVTLPRHRALNLVTGEDGTTVVGVRCKDGDGHDKLLDADLVIDASGRGELTFELLENIGFTLPTESEIGIDQSYSSTTFDIPADAPTNWKAVMTMPTPPERGRLALLFPMENDRWMVMVGGNHGDSPPGDIGGFLEFANSLRTNTIYAAIRCATRVGEIARFAFPRSVRRHYEELVRFPAGLLPFGDAFCRFNPIYGQGMSVATQEACILEKLVGARNGSLPPSHELASSFFKACQPVLDGPWAVAQNDFAYPKTRGSRPPDISRRLRYIAALTRLIDIDPSIHKLYVEVVHLLQPQSALVGPTVFPRIAALMIGGKSFGRAILETYDRFASIICTFAAIPRRVRGKV